MTAQTARLLEHWRGRNHKFQGLRPFFCQVEAAETAIWLMEVAPKLGRQARSFLEHLQTANDQANPGLNRLALKLATGAGKTTVMAMLIAWQAVNAARRPNSPRFTRGFLVVTPGITIQEAARVWITGLQTVQAKLGLARVIDLSATPFFLRGSGYAEGTLFPWTVCDFSLMDAIECGIVKLPRVPVADNVPSAEMPKFRELWAHIGKRMPGAGAKRNLDPLAIPAELQTALDALYGHYEQTFEAWRAAGVRVPPCFIVVCNNQATSKLLYDYISGFTVDSEAAIVAKHVGDKPILAALDPFNPQGTSADVSFRTTKKTIWETDARRCHVDGAVCDSDWEMELCRVLESHPRVHSYVANQGLGFTVPYRMGGDARTYIPDFIVRVDDGHGEEDPLNLVVEVKGYRREDAKVKKQTARLNAQRRPPALLAHHSRNRAFRQNRRHPSNPHLSPRIRSRRRTQPLS